MQRQQCELSDTKYCMNLYWIQTLAFVLRACVRVGHLFFRCIIHVSAITIHLDLECDCIEIKWIRFGILASVLIPQRMRTDCETHSQLKSSFAVTGWRKRICMRKCGFEILSTISRVFGRDLHSLHLFCIFSADWAKFSGCVSTLSLSVGCDSRSRSLRTGQKFKITHMWTSVPVSIAHFDTTNFRGERFFLRLLMTVSKITNDVITGILRWVCKWSVKSLLWPILLDFLTLENSKSQSMDSANTECGVKPLRLYNEYELNLNTHTGVSEHRKFSVSNARVW